jgi:hypothetical protein
MPLPRRGRVPGGVLGSVNGLGWDERGCWAYLRGCPWRVILGACHERIKVTARIVAISSVAATGWVKMDITAILIES